MKKACVTLKQWQRRSVARRYEGGELTVVEIASEFDVSARTVARIVKATVGASRRQKAKFHATV